MTGWQEIAAKVLARIHARTWPPGATIPHEADLAAEFGVARATVNRALQSLADQGWLDRRRRAGTRVALTPVRRATFRIPVIRVGVEGAGMIYGTEVLSRRHALPPAEVTAALGLATPMDGIETLHLANGAPYAAEARWVNPAAVPDFAAADLSQMSANEWLVRHARLTHGDVVFGAASGGEAPQALQARPGQAVMTLTRTTWNGESPVTWVRLWFRPGHQIRAEL
jgi:GntR family transcriptional regulator, histidine utilization repressor